jgi:hypothetical protein
VITVVPSFLQELNTYQQQRRPRGVSADSGRIDEFAASAFRFLVSSPRSTILELDQMDHYVAPGLQHVARKNVRIVKRGQLKPLPIHGEIE